MDAQPEGSPCTQGADSDAALALAAQRGDRAAFIVLLERHGAMLAALCRRALGDEALAEDAVQETALQAMLCLDALRRPERFGAWLCGIGLNVCRRWLRSRWREAWSWEALAGGRRVREPLDACPGPEDLAETAETARMVRRAVAELPSGQRAAVLLVYLSGMSQAEAAAALGTSEGAMKTRLHKARSTLRGRLAVLWEEDTMTTDVRTEPIEMHIVDVRRRRIVAGEPWSAHVVVLQEAGNGRYLPIWVGPHEGIALAMQLERVESHRPLTFSFMAGALRSAGARLRAVRIERLSNDTFYAVAEVEGPAGVVELDARPSDALNLALAMDAPIYAHPAVLATAGVAPGEGDPSRPYPPSARSTVSPADYEGTAQIVAAAKAASEARIRSPRQT